MTGPYDIHERDRVCRAFTFAALQTWEDLRHEPGLGEDSITDYRLLLLKRHCPDEIEVIRFNRRQEAKTGCDWEWWFGSDGQWFGMRVQAKKLDARALEYKHLDHRIGSSSVLQVDQLVEEAVARELFPMYTFYNYWKPDEGPERWPCQTFERRNELWGISVAAAQVVQQLVASGNKSLAGVAMHALPISCLACCRGHARTIRPTLAQRAYGVAKHLRRPDSVPSLVNQLPAYVELSAMGHAAEIPGGPLNRDGILIVRERPAYDDDT